VRGSTAASDRFAFIILSARFCLSSGLVECYCCYRRGIPMMIASSLLFAAILSASTASSAPPIEVYFAPGSSCTVGIVREIGKAKHMLHVQAYVHVSAIARG
jgi:hypothetical protein